jgi:hypothetical protein
MASAQARWWNRRYSSPHCDFAGWTPCRRGDLNPHALAGTSPSSWRVCLFRHSDESR